MNQSLSYHLDELFEAACIKRVLQRLELEESLYKMSDGELVINEAVKRRLTRTMEGLISQGLQGMASTLQKTFDFSKVGSTNVTHPGLGTADTKIILTLEDTES